MFGSPEYLVMRLQEQVARVILPGFAASSAAALVQFLRTGEVSVANNVNKFVVASSLVSTVLQLIA